MRRDTLILRELSGIRGRPAEEASYEANLRECLVAKRCASAEGDLTGAGHAARGAAECYRRLGRHQEATHEYRTAAELFRTAGNARGLAWTLLSFSNLLRQRSQFQAALKSLSGCIKLAQSSRDAGLLGYVVAGIAETTRILGDYPLARRQHLEAYGIFRSLNDTRGIVWALEGIGQILKNTGRLRQALEHFTEAKKIAAAAKDLRGLAYALKCHAESLSGLGHPQSAVEEAMFAVQIFESIGLKVGLGYGLKSLGDIFRASGNSEAGLKSYLRAAEVFSQGNDARGLAYTFNGIGFLLGSLGAADSAAACFGQAASYFKDSELRFGQTQNRSGLRDLATRHQLSRSQMRGIVQASQAGQMALPGLLFGISDTQPPERPELVIAGWQLLNQYRRLGVSYLRAEHAKVWQGVAHADCSSFVQHALIESGHDFAKAGRLTTARLLDGSEWSRRFTEVSSEECRPGDIILQGRRHMGIFTGFDDGQPTGLQMGVISNASVLVWGEKGELARVGGEVRFFRLHTVA